MGSVNVACLGSVCGAWALECVGVVVTAHRLSCSVACGILVSGPGITLMFSALQGRFFTIGPSVMVSISFFFWDFFISFYFWLYSSLLCTDFLELWVGATLSWGAPAPRCYGFSCGRTWALGMWASVVVAHGLLSAGSVVVVHRLSCSVACGVFLDQGLNLWPLRWQVDSLPLVYRDAFGIFLNSFFSCISPLFSLTCLFVFSIVHRTSLRVLFWISYHSVHRSPFLQGPLLELY